MKLDMDCMDSMMKIICSMHFGCIDQIVGKC